MPAQTTTDGPDQTRRFQFLIPIKSRYKFSVTLRVGFCVSGFKWSQELSSYVERCRTSVKWKPGSGQVIGLSISPKKVGLPLGTGSPEKARSIVSVVFTPTRGGIHPSLPLRGRAET